MPPKLALLLGTIFVLFAFRYDRKNAQPVSKALWWPTIWYMVVSSHPFGYWLQMLGIPLPGASDDPTDGSLMDRMFFGILTGIGLWILSRRRFRWGPVLRSNPWITALIVFMAASIFWSQYPFVSFKRFIKIIGSVTMAMLVLTDDNPREAFVTVLRRCLYVHLPMDIICVKYFRDIGVAWDWNGTMHSWNGISATKNVLGQVALLGTLCFLWEVKRRWKEKRWRNFHMLYLLMSLHLLRGSEQNISVTSVSVCVFAVTIFFWMQTFRNRPAAIRPFAYAVFSAVTLLVILVLVHSVVLFSADSVFGKAITLIGRDITLTDRIYIWHDVYAAASGDPLLGVGFGGFWIGRLANIPWNEHMTWILGEAHNGYIETYLQLGWVGGFLLAGMLFSTLPKLLNHLADDFDFGCFRVALFLTLLLINVTESTYIRGDHHLWLVLMMILWDVPRAENTAPVTVTQEAENSPATDWPQQMTARVNSAE